MLIFDISIVGNAVNINTMRPRQNGQYHIILSIIFQAIYEAVYSMYPFI